MKILVLCPFGDGSTYSGPVTFLARLFEPLSHEHEITVLYGSRSNEKRGFPWAMHSVPLTRFTDYGATEQARWAVLSALWVARRGAQYDVVHVHGVAMFNLLAILIGRAAVVSLVAMSGKGDASPRSRVDRLPFMRGLRRSLMRRGTICWALSDEIASEYLTLGVKSTSVRMINNPVDFEALRAATAVGSERVAKRVLGFVGVVGNRKGAATVLRSVSELQMSGWPETKAVFVGPFENSQYEREFRALIWELDLQGAVTCTGFVDDVSSLLGQQMSVFVLPSSKEGMPGALAEAMASGLPSVVTDVGAMGDVIRASGAGQIADPAPRAIATCVASIWRDVETWETYSRRSAAYAQQHFAIEGVVDRFESELHDALDRGTESDGRDAE